MKREYILRPDATGTYTLTRAAGMGVTLIASEVTLDEARDIIKNLSRPTIRLDQNGDVIKEQDNEQ